MASGFGGSSSSSNKRGGRDYKVSLSDSVGVSSGPKGGGFGSQGRSGGSGGGGGVRTRIISAEQRAREQASAQAAATAAAASAARAQRQQSMRTAQAMKRQSGQPEQFRAGGQASFEGTKRDFKSDQPYKERTIESEVDVWGKRVEGLYRGAKEFVVSGAQSELSRGSGVTFTASGKPVAVTPETESILKGLEKERPKDTVAEQIAGGKLPDFADPVTQGEAAFYGALALTPAGGKGIRGISGKVGESIQKGKISQFEQKMGLVGQSERLGKDVYVTGGGTEKRPESIFITKFKKEIDPKTGEITKTPVGEIKPTQGLPQLQPSGVTIIGKVDPVTRQVMGARQEGNFRFTSDLRTGVQRRQYQEGIFQKEFREFATERKTSLENILRGDSEKILKDIKKPKSVYTYSKAEKLEPRFGKSEPPSKVSRTPSTGTVSGGKGKSVFTRQQVTQLKEAATLPTKQKQDAFGTIVTAPGMPAQQAQSQAIAYPPSSKAPGKQTGLTTRLITSPPATTSQGITANVVPSKTQGNLLGGKTGGKLGFTDETKLIVTPGLTPKEGLRFGTGIKTSTGTKQTVTPILDTPFTQKVTEVPEIPPETPKKGVPFGIIPRGGAGFPGGYTRRKRPTRPFVGNVQETKVSGIFNKPEINIGRTRTFKPKKKQKQLGFYSGGKINISGKGRKVSIF